VITFAVVIALAFLTSRFLSQKMGRFSGAGDNRVLVSLPLGHNRGVFVVEVAGKFLVLGVTDHCVNYLQEITDPEMIEKLRTTAPSLPASQFDAVFKDSLRLCSRCPTSSRVFSASTAGGQTKSTARRGKQVSRRFLSITGLTAFIFLLSQTAVQGAPLVPVPNINIGVEAANNPRDVALSLQVLFVLTVLSLAPSILIMMTSFTRIIVVLSFLRSALATQQMPPNQVLVGLALFLTFFTMSPYWEQVNQNALQPYVAGQLTQEAALTEAMKPMREFMFKQTRENDLALFVNISDAPRPNSQEDVPTTSLIPAFVISELKTAFQIGFLVYIPFIVIDMVVASTLMSMGMMMLPPVMISMPFKILLFILVDGWHLVIRSLVTSFN
jgi:flagellar biosynthetic protein FliP